MQDSKSQETPKKFLVKKWLFPFIEAALVVGFFIFVANISANPYSIPSAQSGFAAGPQLQYTCYTPGGCPPPGGNPPTATPVPTATPLPTETPVPTATPLPPTPTNIPVQASVSVAPGQGLPGATLQVSGKNWKTTAPDGSPNKVTLVLDNTSAGTSGAISGFALNNAAPIATLGTFQVGADGSFQGSAVVPNVGALSGQIVATDLQNVRATTPFSVQVGGECAGTTAGQGLRITNSITNLSGGSYTLCVYVVAGPDGVNLNDTIIINLPAGASVGGQAASAGSVSINQNVVRWGGFSLNARQSATLRLSINNGTGNLAANSSILVSGRFNQGQAFQQRFGGLPPLIEIGAGTNSGQGGGTLTGQNTQDGTPTPTPTVLPEAAPASGKGNNLQQPEHSNSMLLIVASLVTIVALVLLGLRRFWLRRR